MGLAADSLPNSVDFPAFGMPPVGRAWSSILPLTHYLKVLVDQSVRGAAPSAAMPALGALLAFVVLAPLVSVWRLGVIARDPRYWGRQ